MRIKALFFLFLCGLFIPLCSIAQNQLSNIKGIHFDGQNYVVTEAVDLRKKSLTIPKGATLCFEGGSISNGTVVLDDTELQGDVKIHAKVSGVVKNDYLDIKWFGVKPNTGEDQTKRVQEVVNLFSSNVPSNSWDINLQKPEPRIDFPAGRYYVGEIKLRSYMTLRGQGRGSTELRGVSFVATGQYNISIEDMSLVGTERKSSHRDIKNPETIKGHSAICFRDSGRIIIKNITIRNYAIAVDFYNTILTDFYSCFISYCDLGFRNDGKGNGYGGHAIRWFGGEICESNVGVVQKMGNSVSFIGATLEGCGYAMYLDYPVSFTISSCYFEANTFDIYGNIVHTNIENCFFSDAHKTKEGTYIYAKTIGQSTIRNNKFNRQIEDRPYVELERGGTNYHNLYIGQNDIVGGGRIIVSNEIQDAIEERGRSSYQTYLPDGKSMLMGQTIVYQNPETGKYYLVTRDSKGELLYLPFDRTQQ